MFLVKILFWQGVKPVYCVCLNPPPPPCQAVDAASLLRLYLNFDLLDAAAELVLEYVDALLGKGHQYFGIEVWPEPDHQNVTCADAAAIKMIPRVSQRPLSATASSVWLPYTSIDQLLKTLNETQTNSSVSHTPFLYLLRPLPLPLLLRHLPSPFTPDVPPSSRQAGRLPPPGRTQHQTPPCGSMKMGGASDKALLM